MTQAVLPDEAPIRSEDQLNQAQVGTLGMRGANRLENVRILGLILSLSFS